MTNTMMVKGILGITIVGVVVFCFVFFRNRRGEITLVITASLAALIIGEFALRFFLPQIGTYGNMFEYDSTLGWKFVPNSKGRIVLIPGAVVNTIETNSLGFRDHAPSDSKKNKIMVLGDSFVSNVSANDEDVFTEIMENQRKDSDVLNFGVNGYGEVQEYLLLKKWIDVINPDLIILVVYLENDFGDNIGNYWLYSRPYASFEGEDSILTLHPQSPVQPAQPEANSRGLLSKSHINRLVTRTIQNLFFKKADSVNIAPEFYTCQSPLSDDYHLRYRVLEALLLKIATLAKEKNVPIVFALAPSMLQVDDKLWELFLEKNRSENKKFIRSLPNDKLMDFAANNNLLMLDLFPTLLLKNRKNVMLYHPREQHWTKEGNRVVANALLDYLKSKSLIE
jgi:hypothetical protein